MYQAKRTVINSHVVTKCEGRVSILYTHLGFMSLCLYIGNFTSVLMFVCFFSPILGTTRLDRMSWNWVFPSPKVSQILITPQQVTCWLTSFPLSRHCQKSRVFSHISKGFPFTFLYYKLEGSFLYSLCEFSHALIVNTHNIVEALGDWLPTEYLTLRSLHIQCPALSQLQVSSSTPTLFPIVVSLHGSLLQ